MLTIHRPFSRPRVAQYRLRVGEFLVFDDVAEEVVSVIQVLSKRDSLDYLGESP